MIDVLFQMPEFVIESLENRCGHFQANGYSGRLYSVCGGPEILSVALPFIAGEHLTSLLRWNYQLASGELPIECTLLHEAGEWWLAQQFIGMPVDAAQRVRWQLMLADCLLLLNRQRQHVSEGKRL